jgi:hypothetical protein
MATVRDTPRISSPPSVPKAKAIAILRNLAEQVDSLTNESRESARFIKWREDCEAATRNIFGQGTVQSKAVRGWRFLGRSLRYKGNDYSAEDREAYLRGLDVARQSLLSMADEIDQYWPDDQVEAHTAAPLLSASKTDHSELPLTIFISHSSEDEPLAKAVVQCLLSCMVLTDGQIRCTSVDGHKLPLGCDTANFLRDELNGPVVVIGLLTSNSLISPWVMFELGAAWCARKDIIPLLAAGAKFDDMPGPLVGSHAAMITDAAALAQAMEQISKRLGAMPRSSAKITAAIQSLVDTVKSLGDSSKKSSGSAAMQSAANATDDDDYIVRQLFEKLHEDILREVASEKRAIALASLATAVRIQQEHVKDAVADLAKWGYVATHGDGPYQAATKVVLLRKGEQYVKDHRLLESKI